MKKNIGIRILTATALAGMKKLSTNNALVSSCRPSNAAGPTWLVGL